MNAPTAPYVTLTREQHEIIRLGGDLAQHEPSVRWPALMSMLNATPSRRRAVVEGLIAYGGWLLQQHAAATYEPSPNGQAVTQ